MIAKIIRIGNSKGLRLSKTILEKYDFGDTVNIRMEDDCLVIEPVAKPRNNWGEAFKEMGESGDDEMLIQDIFEEESEWE